MTFLRQPTRAGVRDAAAKVAAILPATPLFTWDFKGITVAFKAESLQPIGAFKIRGAWHRLTALDEAAFAQAIRSARIQGFDVDRLVAIPQSGSGAGAQR